jgi:hypothetical protein
MPKLLLESRYVTPSLDRTTLIAVQKEPDKSDIMTWLIDAEKNGTDPINRDKRQVNSTKYGMCQDLTEHRWMSGDARLIIVAGSDTTAATLTYIMYHLAKAPQLVEKLRGELREINYLPGSETEVRDIQDAKYLNGVINEALRLHPAVPSGLLRLTPPEGLYIEGTFIPGGVTISSPLYSMGRRESPF